VTASFVIAPLSSDHDRQAFSCGVEPLDRYLRTQATQDIRRRIANCFVATSANSNVVAGYYTFSAASVPMLDLPSETAKRLPRYPVVPAALIGRLAIDREYRGRGLGATLLFDAVARAARADTAIFAVLVDAKDDAAAAFYRHHGFIPFAARPLTLFLPTGTALKLLES
jgi:ribosomal protein S18 acetylase RimI-like enzyme